MILNKNRSKKAGSEHTEKERIIAKLLARRFTPPIIFRLWAWLVFLIMVLFESPYAYGIIENLSHRELHIYSDPQIKGAVSEIVSIYPEIKRELETFFNWKFKKYPINVVIKSKLLNSDRSMLVAYAVPERNVVVLDYFKAGRSPHNLRVTFKHELCHLLLHSHIAKSRLPKWLDEGICQLVSGSFGEISVIPKASVLDKAVRSKRIIPLELLRIQFPNQKEALLLAYEESKSFTSFIVKEYNKQALQDLLKYLREGEAFETAFLQAVSKSFETVEREWLSSLEKRDSLIARLGAYLYELLFAFGAAVTVYAFLRQWRRKKEYMDEDEIE